jgi:hypothetical protein
MHSIQSLSLPRGGQDAPTGTTETSREFVYPVVTEVLRAGAAAPGATGRGGFARWSSQRELVEASLLRSPERPPVPLSPHELSVAW